MDKRRVRVGLGVQQAQDVQIENVYQEVYKNLIIAHDSKKELDESHFPKLYEVIKKFFPIINDKKGVAISLINVKLKQPLHTPEQCYDFSLTYAYTLWGVVRLEIKQPGDDSYTLKEEKELFISIIPKLYNNRFIINGVDKLLTSQLVKSPGVRFQGNKNTAGKQVITAVLIPESGSWVNISLENDMLTVQKTYRNSNHITATALLIGLGESINSLINRFCAPMSVNIEYKNEILTGKISKSEIQQGQCYNIDLLDEHGYVKIKAGNTVSESQISGLPEYLYMYSTQIHKLYSLQDLQHEGHIFVKAYKQVSENQLIMYLQSTNSTNFNLQVACNNGYPIINTLSANPYITKTSDMWHRLDSTLNSLDHQGEKSDIKTPEQFLEAMELDQHQFNIGVLGRKKINQTLGLQIDDLGLTKTDIMCCLDEILKINDQKSHLSDIDSLSLRRIETIDKYIINLFIQNIYKINKIVSINLNAYDVHNKSIRDLVDFSIVEIAIKDLFGRYELTQILDDINPLSSIVHTRKVYNQPGIDKDATTMAMRAINSTYYGRICAIETPEGQNIGLVHALAYHTKIDDDGFLSSKFYKVNNRKVLKDKIYLFNINDESNFNIASAASAHNDYLIDDYVPCRRNSEVIYIKAEEVDYIDCSNRQISSISSSLIPFLEHNVADRALMSCNMQRQSLPLSSSQSPIIGSFTEAEIAKISSAVVMAKSSGTVVDVSTKRIVISNGKQDGHPLDIYPLRIFNITNSGTCFHQTPRVKLGEFVQKGQCLADEICTDKGDLALGVNMRVGYCSLYGYNFEDAIILSEDVVRQGKFTSFHVKEIICYARNTMLGPEELTTDIPGVEQSKTSHLDLNGIVKVGQAIQGNDIIVGKITPKKESILTPEERLLKTIFSNQKTQYEDSSLRLPKHLSGIVTSVKFIDRQAILAMHEQNHDTEELISIILGYLNSQLLTKNQLNSVEDLQNLIKHTRKADKKTMLINALNQIQDLQKITTSRRGKSFSILDGLVSVVKVKIMVEQKIRIGDKLTNRHGAKGVVSNILPRADMPYTADGQPLDVVLSPTGVPSRMNIGQVFEATLGAISVALGQRIKEALNKRDMNLLRNVCHDVYNVKLQNNIDFDNMSDQDLYELALDNCEGVKLGVEAFNNTFKKDKIEDLLESVCLPRSGKLQLYDGRTGKPMSQPSTVGYLYMLKLDHLVDDKMHARSTGPYSLITQQPLGGKSHFGGQRIGEMEAWCLQAYGANNILREMMTVKSDDYYGRLSLYKTIVFNRDQAVAGIPESLKLLSFELKSLGMNLALDLEPESPDTSN